MTLPADLNPRPVHASGMMRLMAGFNSPAITLIRPSDFVQATFSFDADGKLPASAIDIFRAGETVRVIQRTDQISGVAPEFDYYVSDVTFGPKYGDLAPIGAHRAMWFEGDCMTDNITPDGRVYFMRADNITSLNIAANNMTVMQVVQVHNSAYCNQLNPGAGRGCMFATTAVDAGIVQHTRIFTETNAGAATVTTGGGFTAEDGLGFRAASVNAWTETSPFVLTYISGASGTFFGQNQDFRSIPNKTASTRIAVQAFLGAHNQSLPPTAAHLNEAMGMSELATMIWNTALTPGQAAAVAAAFYDLVPLQHLHSHSNAPLVVVMTDSIYAGYKADDLRGWDKVAALQLPTSVRWANFAIPGEGIIFPAIPLPTPYSNTLGLFPGWIAQAIRQHKGRVHCVWGTPLNDYSSFSPLTPTPAFVYQNGTLALINLVRSIDPSATITLCTGTHSTNPDFENAFNLGSTLIRNGAAANGYGVVDVWNDPVMMNAALVTKDGGHLNNFGCARMAELLVPGLRAWLTSLGIT